MIVTPTAAAVEEEMSRRRLLDFVVRTKPDYQIGAHHRLLAAMLELVDAGIIKRLITSTPPRSGKSQLTSIHFPAFYLGRHPERQYILAAHTLELASQFSRQARALFKHDLWPFHGVKLAPDSYAVQRWGTNKGGVFVAAGIGGPLTGRGGHIVGIDDPVKGAEDADSATISESIYDWYTQVARTRLMPGGAVLLTMTRWRTNDICGRLLASMYDGTGEEWTLLTIPALAEGPEVYATVTLPDDLAHQANVEPGEPLTSHDLIERLKGLVGAG